MSIDVSVGVGVKSEGMVMVRSCFFRKQQRGSATLNFGVDVGVDVSVDVRTDVQVHVLQITSE